MNNMIMFIIAFIALVFFLANLGGIIMLVASIFLLYLIIKQFMNSDTTASKVVWIILGIFVLSIVASFSYSVVGLLAVIVLYLIIKKWRENREIII